MPTQQHTDNGHKQLDEPIITTRADIRRIIAEETERNRPSPLLGWAAIAWLFAALVVGVAVR